MVCFGIRSCETDKVKVLPSVYRIYGYLSLDEILLACDNFLIVDLCVPVSKVNFMLNVFRVKIIAPRAT